MDSEASGLIGREYDGGIWEIHAEEVRAYAAATDDLSGEKAVDTGAVPPMFHVRPMIGLMMQMAEDPELKIDLARLVHGEHSMSFPASMRVGSSLEMSGRLLNIEEKRSGTVYTFALWADSAGERVLDGTTTYFVRSASPASKSGGKRPPPESPPPPHWVKEQWVAEDQAVRYASASGDHNPIHTDEAFAKKAGLPGCILHGLCTLAFVARDLIDRFGEGKGDRLRALSTRWARPVFPGSTLTLEAWEESEGRLSFRTMGNDGKPVLTHGTAVLSWV